MSRSHNTSTLFNYLQEAGIQPASFSYFLVTFIESNPDTELTPLGSLLYKQMQAQAELINYHLLPRS